MSNKIFSDKQNIITAQIHVSFFESYDVVNPYVMYEHTENKITSLISCAVILLFVNK